jgi:hypothetical protein
MRRRAPMGFGNKSHCSQPLCAVFALPGGPERAAAQRGRYDHRNLDPRADRTAPNLHRDRSELQRDRRRNRRHPQRRHRQNSPARPGARPAHVWGRVWSRVWARMRTRAARAAFTGLIATPAAATDLRRPRFARQRHQHRPKQCRRDRVRRKHPALLAARTCRVQVPLAGEQRQRNRFCFLRERLGWRTFILRRARSYGLSHPGAARVVHDPEQRSAGRCDSAKCDFDLRLRIGRREVTALKQANKIATAETFLKVASVKTPVLAVAAIGINEAASRRCKLNLGCICNQRACTARPLRKAVSAARNVAD